MNGQVWYHKQIAVHLYQLCGNAVSLLHCQTACHGKGTVKPGSAQHTAVFLHVQLHIVVLCLHLRIFLDFKGGGITVAGHDLETGKCLSRHLKGHNG